MLGMNDKGSSEKYYHSGTTYTNSTGSWQDIPNTGHNFTKKQSDTKLLITLSVPIFVNTYTGEVGIKIGTGTTLPIGITNQVVSNGRVSGTRLVSGIPKGQVYIVGQFTGQNSSTTVTIPSYNSISLTVCEI